MYKKVSTDMNFVEREKQVEKFWEDNQIFEKSMKVREGNPAVRRQGKAEIQSPGRFLRICEGRGRQYDIEDHGRKSVLEPWQVFGD